MFTQTPKLLPNSFITALEEIEDEITKLSAEAAYYKKEYKLLKSEFDTITDIAKSQHTDIERYLAKEIKILDDIIQT